MNLIPAALVVCTSFAALAESGPLGVERPAPAALVEETLAAMRAREIIDQWPQQIVAMNLADPRFAQLKREARSQILMLLQRSFDAKRMYAQVSARMARAVDARTLEAFLATWRLASVQRIQELEVLTAQDLAQPGVLENYARRIQASPPSAGRRELIATLDRLTEGSETMASIQAASYLAALAYGGAADLRDMRRQLEALKPKLLEGSRAFIELLYLYTYRSLSDDELRRYAALYERPEVAGTNRALNQAVGETMIGALEAFFRAMRDLQKAPAAT